MSDLLLQVAVSNVVLSGALAALAYAVHRRAHHPVLAHALWVAVLLKLVTPPLVMLPLVPAPSPAAVAPSAAFAQGSAATTTGDAATTILDALTGPLLADLPTLLVLVWALGSALVLAVSLLRIRRFEHLLRRASVPAPPPLARAASALAASLGLRSVPAIELSRARVSPMTWWMGGRVRIIIPSALAERTDPQQLRWILAHELAHVRRRDHLVRWLEWLACVAFWWDPLVWWARRKLREAEEASCDALVLERMDGPRRSYAHALLAVVELLARPTAAPLALATGIGAGGQLERRFRAIIADRPARPASRRLQATILLMTVASLSVGVGAPHASGSDADPDRSVLVGLAAAPEWISPAAADPASDDGYAFVSGSLGPIGRSDTKRRRSARGVAALAWDDVFIGTDGPDSYAGTSGRDLVDGRAGRDDLSGRRGRDLIRGGPDRDVMAAGPADDLVVSWRDGVRDTVDCGPGDGDRAVVDPTDVVTGCEIVERREPSG